MALSEIRGQSVSFSRIDDPLEKLEKLVASGEKTDVVLEALTSQGGRNFAFALQELFRLYEEDQENGKKWRRVAKRYEDLIGHRTDVFDWRAFVKDLPAESKLKEQINTYLNGELATRTEESLAELKELVEDEALGKVRKDVEEWKFGSYGKDRLLLLTALEKHLKGIETKRYDLSKLEGQVGIHEFRRDIRQFLIAARALNGLIVFDSQNCPLPAYRPLLTDPVAQAPYNQLPENRSEQSPCAISKCLYLGLSKLSDDLSEAKDIGQGEEMLARFFLQQKEKESAALVSAQKLAKLHPGYHDYRSRAKKLRQEMLHSELLYHVRQELKACLD